MSKALLQLDTEAPEAPMDEVRDLAQALVRAEQGDPHAAAELMPLVSEELRRLAAHKLAREKPGQTLSPAALVHEVWLRLNQSRRLGWRGRGYFFRAAAEALRRLLVDNARRKSRRRDGGPCARVDEGWIDLPLAANEAKCLQVHEVLDRLTQVDPRKAEVAKLRLFVGLEAPEIAAALHASETAVQQDWTFAEAWLSRELRKGA